MWSKDNRLRRWTGTLMVVSTLGGLGGCASTISTQQEVQLGRQHAAQINRQLPLVRDRAANEYINALGDAIAQRVDRRGIDYTFYIVNEDAINAFALPGGHVYVNRGLIERTRNVSELAGVLAHEIAHVVERHGVEQMSKAQNANLGLSVLYGVLLGRQPSTIEQVGIQGVGGAVFAGYSRDAEREADRRAVEYLVQTGIHPGGLPSFFGVLMEERRRNPSRVERWFATHPTTEERIEITQALVRQIPESQLRRLDVQTPRFQEFQARVNRLPAAPRSR